MAGSWIDRLGHRVVFSGAMLLSIIGCLMTLAPNLAAVIGGLSAFCTGIFIAQSSASFFIGMATNDAKASAVGLYTTAYYLGGSFGAAIPGITWSWGGWSACVGLMIIISLANIAVVWFFLPKATSSKEEDMFDALDPEAIVYASDD